jgi:ubiquinone/menaquinone biosynthesis C-methylase UbiE
MSSSSHLPGVGGPKFLRGYFDLAARRYAADIEPAFAPLAAGLVDFAEIARGTSVVDLGTGTGLLARMVADISGAVCAIDFSRRMLREARRQGVRREIQADLHALPFRDGTFRLALASFAFNSTDPDVSLREAWRIVQPGGRLVFQEWGAPDPLSEIVSDTLASYAVDDPSPELARMRSETEQPVAWDDLESLDEIQDIVARAGFEVSRVEVLDAEVLLADLDTFLRYKLAWPSRQAEIAAMPDDVRRLMSSDLRENLSPHADGAGGLTWRPQIIRISAGKP